MAQTELYPSIVSSLQSKFGTELITAEYVMDELHILVDRSIIFDCCSFLKDEHRFIYLADIVGTDRFTSEDRFEVIYNVISLKTQTRIHVKTRCEEENPTLPTVTPIWNGANWPEREVYDMFGIHFEGHPDMRRIFLPEDFQYYPLRKEFPLLGVPGSIDLPNTTPDINE
jgi:NADH-quinone oxidoreductase subunit C